MDKILFVCTANIFRSVSAHYIIQDYVLKNNLEILVSSAGIEVDESLIFDDTITDTLFKFGIDATEHIPRQITKKIIEDFDLIVVMGKNHFDYIKKNFDLEPIFFNEIISNSKTPVMDVTEIFSENKRATKGWTEYIIKVITCFYDNKEKFIENYKKFLKK